MKGLPQIAGLLGLLLLVVAVAGRFYSLPTITLGGEAFAASTFLLLGNTALLAGIFLKLMCRAD